MSCIYVSICIGNVRTKQNPLLLHTGPLTRNVLKSRGCSKISPSGKDPSSNRSSTGIVGGSVCPYLSGGGGRTTGAAEHDADASLKSGCVTFASACLKLSCSRAVSSLRRKAYVSRQKIKCRRSSMCCAVVELGLVRKAVLWQRVSAKTSPGVGKSLYPSPHLT